MVNNLVNCAPFHLPGIDPSTNHQLTSSDANLACKIWHLTKPEETLLLCDACSTGWHMVCMDKEMEEVPEAFGSAHNVAQTAWSLATWNKSTTRRRPSQPC